MPKAKTEGLEWLIYSLMSFNGSGYADMNSAEDYLDSYMAYNKMRKREHAIALTRMYYNEVLPTIEQLLEKTLGAGRQPSDKNIKRFEVYKNQTHLL